MRMQMTREFYIPKGWAVQNHAELDVVIYTNDDGAGRGKLSAMGFAGKAIKPTFNYWFSTPEQRTQHITKFLEGRKAEVESRARYAAERKAFKSSLRVGDILVSSGGYDQTNVQALQVVAVIGKKSVDVREVAVEQVKQGADGPREQSMADYVQPVRDSFTGEPMRRTVRLGDTIKAAWGSASKWDGERSYYRSWYA